ncbi:MAG: hypothetical protein A2284_16515 [Deltaproteobacteria bacterium RIFOXYA12_FULL_61_11]|nr:MAG: hypothetical protein A2284_16515 [Deltaproteobacteria bacterium RIFOXYA12_FULL_61_11]
MKTLLPVLFLAAALCGCGEEPFAGFKTFLAGEGRSLGTFSRTLYILAFEADFEDETTQAYDKAGLSLGWFPAGFLDDLCLQGSGMTAEGVVMSLSWSGCSGTTFSSHWCTNRCFSELDPQAYPYGSGASGESPIPFRGVAVDRAVIPMHTRLYIPLWDGYVLPNGATHDGCFAAKDTGGAIKGQRIDIHAGVGRKFYELVAAEVGGRRDEQVYADHPKCAGTLVELVPKQVFLDSYQPGWTPGQDPPPEPEVPQAEPEPAVEPFQPNPAQPPVIPPAVEEPEDPEPLVFGQRATPTAVQPSYEREETVSGGCGLVAMVPSHEGSWLLLAGLSLGWISRTWSRKRPPEGAPRRCASARASA